MNVISPQRIPVDAYVEVTLEANTDDTLNEDGSVNVNLSVQHGRLYVGGHQILTWDGEFDPAQFARPRRRWGRRGKG